jgi:hypothetical protein
MSSEYLKLPCAKSPRILLHLRGSKDQPKIGLLLALPHALAIPLKFVESTLCKMIALFGSL